MQIKTFTLPIYDPGQAEEELNRFLRGHKILAIESQFYAVQNGAYWCFCIRYQAQSGYSDGGSKAKMDYKLMLDEPTFARFSKLRAIRKRLAEDEGVPAFAIFTDAELAELARLETITASNLGSVKGVGPKKIERYGIHFIAKDQPHETHQSSDSAN